MIISLVIAFVALEHIGFLILESVLWTRPAGRKVFHLTEQFANETKGLAANQGLYNGFLAAGLIWSLVTSHVELARQLQIFFLSCVFVAGIFGGITVKKSIFVIQGIPALLALTLVLFA